MTSVASPLTLFGKLIVTLEPMVAVLAIVELLVGQFVGGPAATVDGANKAKEQAK